MIVLIAMYAKGLASHARRRNTFVRAAGCGCASGAEEAANAAAQSLKAVNQGAGLIVMQVAGVHETARYTAHLLMATSDDCIPGYARVAGAVHEHGCALFGQLFHPGREIMESQDGTAPSCVS